MVEAMDVDDSQYNTAAARDKGKGKAVPPAPPAPDRKSYNLPWVSPTTQQQLAAETSLSIYLGVVVAQSAC